MICAYCDRSLFSLHHTVSHYREYHWNDIKNPQLSCHFCKTEFPFTPETLKEFEVHFVKCALQCNITEFTPPNSILKKKTGSRKKFKCDDCEAKFMLESQLVNHHKLVHQGVLLTCEHCKKRTYTNGREYRTHLAQCPANKNRDKVCSTIFSSMLFT